MTLRRLLGAVLGFVVLGALTAGIASAVRATVDRGAGKTAAVAAQALPVVPPVGASGLTGTPAAALPAPVDAAQPPSRTRRRARVPVAPDVSVPAPVRPSRALGKPNRGRLAGGVLLPADGPDVTTWDAVLQTSPNRDWRRVGTDRLVRTILTVAADYRRANPGAPRVVVSDLSLPQGGRFGSEYGGLGHASHQNGLDADIAFPRKDRQEIGVSRVSEVDRVLAQRLVDGFVAAGAQFVFVGPRTGLKGPAAVVQKLVNHDDHLHVRIPNVR